MPRAIICLIICLSLSACMGAGQSDGALVPQTSMPEGTETVPPSAFLAFCKRTPTECSVPYTPEFEEKLSNLHQSVQQTIVSTEEEGDFWQIVKNAGPGDCEDFALTLRHKLREAFPDYSAAFLLATAFTENNIYHAVLSIETSAGTIVCDIRYAKCGAWETFPYRWRLREVANAFYWEEIGTAVNRQLATAMTGRR